MNEQPEKGFVLVVVINFIDSVFDTDQISVFRGGSELARWLPYHLQGSPYREDVGGIHEPYEKGDQLKAISLGGSKGLYAAENPEAVAADIARHVNAHPSFRYLSVAVAGVEAETEKEALPKLMAMIAWQQVASHRVKPDYVNKSMKVCVLTGVRAAGSDSAIFPDGDNIKSVPVSPSALLRLKFGRKLRKNGLLLEAVSRAERGKFDDYHLSDSFEEIAGKSSNGDLEKIAYIYWDGNSFGKFNQQAENSGKIQEWDRCLRDNRAKLMEEIIESAKKYKLVSDVSIDPDTGKTESDKKMFRLEPLLWGGDESLLVMPAAAALPLLHFIQNCTSQWQFDFGSDAKKHNLTHAFGLLFCSSKTPVREARAMAASLAELGKQRDGGRNRDSWTTAVLNSIDYEPSGDMGNHLDSRYGKELAPVFHGLRFVEDHAHYCKAITNIIDPVSRGQLRRLAGSVVASKKRWVDDKDFAWKRMIKQLEAEQAKQLKEDIQFLSAEVFDPKEKETEQHDGAVLAFLEELYEYLPGLSNLTEQQVHEAV